MSQSKQVDPSKSFIAGCLAGAVEASFCNISFRIRKNQTSVAGQGFQGLQKPFGPYLQYSQDTRDWVCVRRLPCIHRRKYS